MLDLLAPSASRTLVVVPYRTFKVPAPTVREALAVLGTLQCWSEDEGLPAGKAELLREACAEWLPTTAFSVLFSEAFEQRRRLAALEALVTTGMPKGLLGEVEAEAEGARKAGEVRWQALVARYRAAFGLTWEEALDEPWPAFLAQLTETRTLHAQEQMRFIRAYSALRSEEGKTLLDQIRRDASLLTQEKEELSEEEKETRKKQEKKLMAEAWQVRQHLLN